MRDGSRLIWLVGAHLALGFLAAALATVEIDTPFGLRHLLIVPLFALTFSQVSLLGLWGVFFPTASRKRLSGLALGTAYLECAFDRALGSEFLLMPSAAMALTIVSLLIVRRWGARLSRKGDDVDFARSKPEGFRFSIRRLMVLIAVVALLSAVARSARESPQDFRLVLSVIWSICFVVAGLLALVAALEHSRSLRRGLSAVAVSAVLGAFFAYAADAHRDGWVYVMMIMVLYPAVLLGSLVVVRSCGDGLVRRAGSVSDPPDLRSGSLPPGIPASGVGSPE
jgi:hypothetical protein